MPLPSLVFKGTVTRKLNPTYVAIHSSKALSLRIVHQPTKIKFFKGTLRKLHIKVSALTTHLPLKVRSFSQVESSMFTCCAYFAKQKTFKAWSTHSIMTLWQFIEHCTWKVLCMTKSTHAFNENLQLSKYICCTPQLERNAALSKANKR